MSGLDKVCSLWSAGRITRIAHFPNQFPGFISLEKPLTSPRPQHLNEVAH